jgi:hypothetical protein
MRVLLLSAILLILGCASTLAPMPTIQREHGVGERPPLNARVEKSVGEVIYEIYDYTQERVLAAKIAAPINIDVFAAKAAIPIGSLLESYQDGPITSYCTREFALSVTLSGPTSRVCVADKNNDGRFESWKAPEGPPARRAWANLKSQIPFSTEESTNTAIQGFRYELLYQGISGNVVSLLYREFSNDLIRPAFQQDLTYTLEPEGPTEVSFRGTKLRIYSAGNNGISYEVLSGLSPGAGGSKK